jgi:hypothetical protein
MKLVSIKNIGIVAMLASLSGGAMARSAERNEDCRLEAETVAGGLERAVIGASGVSAAQPPRLTLIDKSDTITYSLDIDLDGAKLTYSIELSNDSASRCMPLSVSITN